MSRFVAGSATARANESPRYIYIACIIFRVPRATEFRNAKKEDTKRSKRGRKRSDRGHNVTTRIQKMKEN